MEHSLDVYERSSFLPDALKKTDTGDLDACAVTNVDSKPFFQIHQSRQRQLTETCLTFGQH